MFSTILRLCLCVFRRKRLPGYFSFPIRFQSDNDHSKKIFQVKDFNTEKTPITSLLWNNRKKFSKRNDDGISSKVIPLPTIEKSAKDSSLIIEYDFSDDSVFRDTYVDARGSILLGKLFEDLDAFAGNIALSHTIGTDSTIHDDHIPSLVTASVDRITLSSSEKILSITRDNLLLCGQVAWVGNSSLDVVMEIHDKNAVLKYNPEGIPLLIDSKGSSSRLISSFFTFVARSRKTGQAVKINKLKPSSEAEGNLTKIREKLAQSRRSKSVENVTDKNLLMALVERGVAIEDMPALAHTNSVLMRSTSLENSFICQPQNGNTAGRVFGGFLMHRAYDLALATCYTFAGSYPQFREVDKVVFKRPVDIGDLIRLKSRIIFSSDHPIDPIAMVEVTCQIVRPEKALSFVSNSFVFEFGFNDIVTLRKVLPSTYEEASILYSASKTVGIE